MIPCIILPTILLVEDEKITIKYFIRFFSEDYNILVCSNINEAKFLLENNLNISLVISDNSLINCDDGEKLMKHCKDNYPNIKRILFTGYATMKESSDYVKIDKPKTPMEVKEIIDKILMN
jgi:DNA-binding NtrC family response regulator